MRNYLKLFKRNSGFTLIELLVVIGILGVLAAALIATIDPFEQIKKANDANVKNATVEFVNANIRYYSTHNALPWGGNGAGAVSGCVSSTTIEVTDINSTGCLNALIGDGELKTAFTLATNAIDGIVYSGGDNSVTACFKPQSKSEQRDPNTKYTVSAGVPADGGGKCGVTGTAVTDCYWCSF
jgi:prepilin-type N-terminal cleavage/methylation domain-containing protein